MGNTADPKDRDVSAINLRQRWALSTDNLVGEVVDLFNRGKDTKDYSKATGATVKWPDGLWSSVDLTKFDFNTQLH